MRISMTASKAEFVKNQCDTAHRFDGGDDI